MFFWQIEQATKITIRSNSKLIVQIENNHKFQTFNVNGVIMSLNYEQDSHASLSLNEAPARGNELNPAVKAVMDHLHVLLKAQNNAVVTNPIPNIELNCNEIDLKAFQVLFATLYESHYPIHFVLKSNSPEAPVDKKLAAYNRAFAAISERNIAIQKINKFSDAENIKQSFGKTTYGDIRPSKINMLHDSIGGMSLQQQQQQPERIHVDDEDYRRPVANNNEHLDKDQFETDDDNHNSSEFITRDNILQKLGDFFRATHPNMDVKQLQTIWDNVVCDQQHAVITHIQIDAMKKIIEHYQDLNGGLTLEHLPIGFKLKTYKDPQDSKPSQIRLYYSNEAAEAALKAKPDPFRLNWYSREIANDQINQMDPVELLCRLNPENLSPAKLAEAMVEVQDNLESVHSLKTQIQKLCAEEHHGDAEHNSAEHNSAEQGDAENKKNASAYFFNLILKGAPAIQSQLQTLNLAEDETFRVELCKIALTQGIPAAELFLQQLIGFKLTQNEHYQQFKKTFIDGKSDLVQFANEEGRNHLKNLMEFKTAEFNWWETLSAQHIASGATADFNAIFKAFLLFNNKIKQVERSLGADVGLPNDCPFTNNIKNMIVALDRALFIIQHDDPETELEQINLLLYSKDREGHGIDLSATGGYYARKYHQYRLIDARMDLHANADLPCLTVGEIIAQEKNHQFDYATLKQAYYRYLGRLADPQYNLAIFSQIEAIISKLDDNKIFSTHPQWKSYLLEIALIFLTKTRTELNLLPPDQQISNFIHLIENILSDEKNEKNKLLVEQLFVSLLSMHDLPQAVKPTLTEVTTWCSDLIQKNNTDNVIQFYDQLPTLMQAYGMTIYQVMKIAEERQQLSLVSPLLKPLDLAHLFVRLQQYAPKNLATITPDQQSALQDFAIILSLVNDVNNEEAIADIAKIVMSGDKDQQSTVHEFCQYYKTINLERIAQLPDMDSIISVMKNAKVQCQNQNSAVKSQQIKRAFATSPLLKDLVFGQKSIEQSTYGVVDVIKTYFDLHDVSKNIRYLKTVMGGLGFITHFISDQSKKDLARINGLIPELEEEVQKLIKQTHVKTDANNALECLNILKKIDDYVYEIIITAVNNGRRDDVVSFFNLFIDKSYNTVSLTNQFIAQPSILIFMSPDINEKFSHEINVIFKKLLLSNSALHKYCTDYLGAIHSGGDFLETINSHSHKFEDITRFTNALTEVKNKNDNDFIKLRDVTETILAGRTGVNLTLNQLSQLLAILIRHKSIPAYVTLANICKELTEHPELSNNINNIIASLDVLMQFQDGLTDAQMQSAINSLFINNAMPRPQSLTSKNSATTVTLDKEQIKELMQIMLAHSEATALIIDIAKVATELCCKNQALGHDFMAATVSAIKTNALNHPGIFNYLKLLFILHQREKGFITQYYQELINNLTHDASATPDLLQIVLKVSETKTGEIPSTLTGEQLTKLFQKLKALPRGRVTLKEIAKLYAHPPFPEQNGLNYLDTLLSLLDLDDQQLDQTVTQLDHDPYHRRQSADAISSQFNTDRIFPTITGIRDLIEENTLNKDEISNLGQQCLNINNIGKDYPLLGSNDSLSNFSREDLKSLAKQYMDELGSSSRGQKRDNLDIELLAVLREILFRTTGEFPYTSQLIAVLQAMNHPDNLLLQIATGEGKSITTALMAVIQWAKGDTVDLCTANMDLAGRDYQHFKNFFDFLSIPTNLIEANRLDCGYQIRGINYSTVADLSLVRARYQLDGIDINHQDGKKIPTSLILDEVDYNTLLNRTQFNYTLHAASNKNEYDWIYPLLNEFIALKKYRSDDVKNGAYSSVEDVWHLEQFLKQKITDDKQLRQLTIIKDNNPHQLAEWINEANIANTLKYERDFAINVDVTTGKAFVIPKNDSIPQLGSTYKNGVQQCLHARLQKEFLKNIASDKPLQFPIDPELPVAASASSKTFIDYYLENGRVIGVSGTLGAKSELMEQQYNLRAKTYRIPQHKPSKRKTQFTVTKDHQEKIAAIQERITGKQPLLQQIKNWFKTTKQNDVVDVYDGVMITPALLVCHDSLKALAYFHELTGISYSDWSDAKTIFAQIATNTHQEKEGSTQQLAQINYKKYAKNIASLVAIGKLNETIFKNAPQIQAIINKMMHYQGLNAYDLRVIEALASNTYYQQRADDFNHFKEIVKAIQHQQPLPNDFQNHVSQFIHGIFANQPKLIEILKNLVTGTSPTDAQIALLKEASEKPWYAYNQGEYHEYELTVGDETAQERANKISQIQNPYHITISTKLLGRGTDAKNKMLVIQSYTDTQINSEQIMGRCARNDIEGVYWLLLDEDDLEHSNTNLVSTDKQYYLDQVQHIQQTMEQDAASQRYYLRTVDGLNNIVMHEFHRFEKFITALHAKDKKNHLYYQKQDDLVLLRVNLIKHMEQIWENILAKSDKDNKYVANPYVRRDANHELQQAKLDEAISTYRGDLNTLWQKTKEELIEGWINDYPVDSKTPDADAAINKEKLNYLQQISLDELFADDALHLQKQHQLALTHENTYDERDLAYALNPEKAYSKYTKQPLTCSQQFSSIAHTLMVAYYDLEKIILAAKLSTLNQKELLNLHAAIHVKTDILALKEPATSLQEKGAILSATLNKFYDLLGKYKKHCDKLEDKFAAQPIMHELFVESHKIKFVKSPDMQVSEARERVSYMEHGLKRLIKLLTSNVSWVHHKKAFEYKLEREAICQAAERIDMLTNQLDAAPNKENLLNLQEALRQYQIETAHLLSFNSLNPFGHKDFNQVVTQALAMLGSMNYFEDKNHQSFDVSDHEKNVAKGQGEFLALRNKILQVLNRDHASSDDKRLLAQIVKTLTPLFSIVGGESTLAYQVYDIYYWLKHYSHVFECHELKKHSQIKNGLQELQSLCLQQLESYGMSESRILTDKGFLTYKQKQIMQELNLSESGKQQQALKRLLQNTTISIIPHGGKMIYELTAESGEDIAVLKNLDFKQEGTGNQNLQHQNLQHRVSYLQKRLIDSASKVAANNKSVEDLTIQQTIMKKNLETLQAFETEHSSGKVNNAKDETKDEVKDETARSSYFNTLKSWVKEGVKQAGIYIHNTGLSGYDDDDDTVAAENNLKEAADKRQKEIMKLKDQLNQLNEEIENKKTLQKILDIKYHHIMDKLNAEQQLLTSLTTETPKYKKVFQSINELLDFELSLRKANAQVEEPSLVDMTGRELAGHESGQECRQESKISHFGHAFMNFFHRAEEAVKEGLHLNQHKLEESEKGRSSSSLRS